MLKKTITYTDFNGVERTEDFYFSLNKAEIFELQATTEGGFTDRIQKAVDSKDTVAIMRIFKEMILRSVGKKSDDGKRFVKNRDIADEFEQSPAYEILFMELATDPESAKVFMEGVMPAMSAEQKAEYEQELKKLESK